MQVEDETAPVVLQKDTEKEANLIKLCFDLVILFRIQCCHMEFFRDLTFIHSPWAPSSMSIF